MILRSLFLAYIIFMSSFDTAIAEEFAEMAHSMQHEHRISHGETSLHSLAQSHQDLHENESNKDNSDCPATEGCHAGHQCHVGHCGFLIPSLSLKVTFLSQSHFREHEEIFQSRALGSLFRPPKLS